MDFRFNAHNVNLIEITLLLLIVIIFAMGYCFATKGGRGGGALSLPKSSQVHHCSTETFFPPLVIGKQGLRIQFPGQMESLRQREIEKIIYLSRKRSSLRCTTRNEKIASA